MEVTVSNLTKQNMLDVVKKVDAFFDSEQRWTKGSFGRVINKPIPSYMVGSLGRCGCDDDLSCCLIGAIYFVEPVNYQLIHQVEDLFFYALEVKYRSVFDFNDSERTKFTDIKSLIVRVLNGLQQEIDDENKNKASDQGSGNEASITK